jgi:hypothetical protein
MHTACIPILKSGNKTKTYSKDIHALLSFTCCQRKMIIKMCVQSLHPPLAIQLITLLGIAKEQIKVKNKETVVPGKEKKERSPLQLCLPFSCLLLPKSSSRMRLMPNLSDFGPCP